jgi:hypothetical protein
MVGDIISEQRAELSRNGGRLHSGTVGGFGRNPQPALFVPFARDLGGFDWSERELRRSI